MSNRTKGKWVVSSSIQVCNTDGIMVSSGTALMSLPEEIRPKSFDELAANAALIAAAPEMLEALREVLSFVNNQDYNSVIDRAWRIRDIVNKAENKL